MVAKFKIDSSDHFSKILMTMHARISRLVIWPGTFYFWKKEKDEKNLNDAVPRMPKGILWLLCKIIFNQILNEKKIHLPKPSPQSLSPSHLNELGIHLPVEHRKSVLEHDGVVQFWFSSELSRQSSSPSQTQVLGMHRWLSHVKSQELGQAWTGGSAEGSDAHVFPSPLSLKPYGQPHFATMPTDVVLSGTGKHNFWQPPFSLWQGWFSVTKGQWGLLVSHLAKANCV